MRENGEDDNRGSERFYYVQKNYASLTVLSYSFSLSIPSDIFSLSVSLQRPPPSRFCLIILLHSLTIYFPSSFFASPSRLSSSLSFPFLSATSILGKHGIPEPLWNLTAGMCMCMLMHTCLLACSCSGNMLSLNQICISNLSAGLLHWPGALLYLHIELWGSPESL